MRSNTLADATPPVRLRRALGFGPPRRTGREIRQQPRRQPSPGRRPILAGAERGADYGDPEVARLSARRLLSMPETGAAPASTGVPEP